MVRSSVVTAALLGAASVPCVAAYRYAHAPLPESPPPAESSTWARVDQGPDFDPMAEGIQLQQAAFGRDGVGLAVGPGGRIWRSTDRGRSWRRSTGPLSGQFGVSLLDDGRGFLGGLGLLHASADGGETWTPARATLRSPRHGGQALIAWILHAPPDILVFGGDRAIGRSEDGGRTWAQLDVPPQRYYGSAISGSTVLAVGGGGMVLRSTDTGATWREHALGSTAMLRAVAFADPMTAVAVGTDGTVLRSQDAGLTWAEVASGTRMHLTGVRFVDADHGVIVGFHGTALLTRDGGRSWQLEETGTRNHLFNVAVAPDGAPVAVGWFDTILRRSPLIPESGHGT